MNQENGQLCLPNRVVYPKHYTEALVVDTRAREEYVKSSLGRRQGAAAVKHNARELCTPSPRSLTLLYRGSASV